MIDEVKMGVQDALSERKKGYREDVYIDTEEEVRKVLIYSSILTYTDTGRSPNISSFPSPIKTTP